MDTESQGRDSSVLRWRQTSVFTSQSASDSTCFQTSSLEYSSQASSLVPILKAFISRSDARLSPLENMPSRKERNGEW